MPDTTPPTAGEPADNWKLRARWLWDGHRFVGEDLVLEIAAGRLAGITRGVEPAAFDLGNALILPGLVNAHTHLEFSDLPHPLRNSLPFTRWAAELIQVRRNRTAPDSRGSVQQGLRESAAAGTTAVGEITTDELSVPDAGPGQPRAVSFREIIGLDPTQAELHLQTASAHLKADRTGSAVHLARGISPHAPYSVHRELLTRLVQLAADWQVPVAMHLAETRSELQLLEHGTGEFQHMLQALGVWREGLFPAAGLGTPRNYLEQLAQAPAALVIHGNYLAETDLHFLADCPHLTLVYCPRTHAYFRHAAHPWQRLLDLGGRVVLGTDGRGSTPDLSIWRELRFLARRHPGCSSSQLLPLATTTPPGLDSRPFPVESARAGAALRPGAAADLTVVRLPPGAGFDIERDLLRSTAEVCGTMRAGRWIHPPEEEKIGTKLPWH